MNLPRANMPSLALDAIVALAGGLLLAFVALLSFSVSSGLLQSPLKCFCQDKEDISRAGARKLAFESYLAWTAVHANAGQCPTAEQLAEYGGSAKDPWGQRYDIDCTDLRDLHVSSRGADKRAGTGDDQRSWE